MVEQLIREEDREGERALAQVLEDAWGCEVMLLPRQAAVDGLAVRDDQVEGVLEFKERAELVDPVWVSRRKVDALRWLAEGFSVSGRRRCRGVFVVRCGDRVGWVDAEAVKWCKVAWVGRAEPREGTVQDREECYLVGLGAFAWLNGFPPKACGNDGGDDGAEDAGDRRGAG